MNIDKTQSNDRIISSPNNVRITLAVFSAILTVALGFFVWIMLDASSNAMSSVLLNSLILIVCVTVIAQVIYALKGQIFEFDGRPAKHEILFAVICFQVVMQFSFGFSLYAVKQTELQNTSLDSAYAYFIELQQSAAGNTIAGYQALDLEKNMPECVESVRLANNDDSGGSDQYFRFPISGGRLLMKKSSQYFTGYLREFAASLLMSLIISVLLMAELVYLAVKYLSAKHLDSRNAHGDKAPAAVCPAGYLRQIAFLFYFAGFLGASFIPLMAHGLSGDNPNADFIAGMPYTVEAFANCIAIVLATRFFRKKGWKPPYILGVGIFITGIVLSALSPNVFLFIASRAVAGAGYGFCWMTLRNITTLSGNRAENFSNLSAGIYAGIMCGVAFGSVLADSVGYRSVLLISAVMAIMAAALPMMFRNDKGGQVVTGGVKIRLTAGDVGVLAVFLILIVIPTCISDAFGGYVLPLYINKLQLPTAYIGRASLIYNLCLVYLSSTILRKLVWKLFKNPLHQCALHMILISLALFAAAYLGGFQAMIIAAALLGSADGFGFSVQNAYVLDIQAGIKLGHAQMLTYFSLFKKFGAMLGPVVYGLFIMKGFQGLGVMGITFLACITAGVLGITFLDKKEARA